MSTTKPGHPYALTVDRDDLEQNGLHAVLRTRDPGGCWAVHAHGDSGPHILTVHATEIDALRAAVAHYMPDASAVWLPWGIELGDALKTPETGQA